MTAPAQTRPAPTAPAGSSAHALTGTWLLLVFMLRRDRVRLAVWTGSVVALWLYAAVAFTALYSTPEERQTRAELMSTPATILMSGPGYGTDSYTIGAMFANELLLWVSLTLAIMSILQVVRHTRAEEESGRSELVRAGVVGRHAPAMAAMAQVVVVNVVIAVLAALVLVGLAGLGVGDSIVMVSAIALTVLVFAAVASVTCQLTAHARGASGMAVAVLGLAVMTRGIGDIQHEHGSALSWTSPIAWAQQTRVYVDTRIWPLALSVVAIVVLLALAVVLAGHRDFGAGMFADRRGRADARPGLRSPLALAWRQQRTALGWWTLGTAGMWVGCGTLIPDVGPMFEEMIEENPVLEQVFGATAGDDMTAAFLVIMMLLAGMLAVGYGIAAVLRARAEETAGRTEYLLATPVSRARWLGAQTAVAGLGAAVVMLAGGLGMAAGAYAAGASDPGFGTYVVATLAYLPAVAVVMGVTVALYAWLPRWESVSWVFLVLAVVVGMFGEVFRLPDAVRGLSPLWWVPAVPSEDFAWPPVLGLTAVAVALLALAFVGFRRRDIPVS